MKRKLIHHFGITAGITSLFVFFGPLSYDFSYAAKNCHVAPMLFPGVIESSEADYTVTPRGGTAFFSTELCITPKRAIDPGYSSLVHGIKGSLLFGRSIMVYAPEKPIVASVNTQKPIAAKKALTLQLSAPDKVHMYEIAINNKVVECTSDSFTVSCPLQKAALDQGKEYSGSLQRSLNGQIEVLNKALTIRTLKAATVMDASIAAGSIVYDKPTLVSFTMDKDMREARVSLYKLTGEKLAIATTNTVDGKQVKVAWEGDLARNETYEVRIESVEAIDGSDLADPYTLSFKTSGGPAVRATNIQKAGVAGNARITVTFDQAIDVRQQLSKTVLIQGVPATVSLSSDATQAVIQLQNAQKCTDFSVNIPKGVLSQFGIPSETAWMFSARTICHSVETIGVSYKGRAIHAYTYGTGPTSVLFTGAIHGSEASSSYLLQDFMSYLEAHAREIPSDRSIVVVPTINPDGFVSNSRFNARNVNLNRNFATTDWKKDIKDTGGTVQSGGGSEPMSENETKAIAALASRLRPRLVLSYHAVGSVVIGNGAGHSASAAAAYASSVGYSNGTGASSEIFSYEITGTFDDWLAEKLSVASVVVELGSYSYRNFAHHQQAMWTSALK